MSRTWFVTGASRGLGADIARAALDAGHNVVATSRDRADLVRALGEDGEKLLALSFDVADPQQSPRAVAAALDRFGAIDVLVNNAGYGQFGFFEETSHEDAVAQFDTNVFGVLNLTRAVLPGMRARRTGHIFNISSISGIRGNAGSALYSASKFALEGFSESLAKEVEPFGLFVTIIQPGFFRTEFLTDRSMRMIGGGIADYADRAALFAAALDGHDGRQPGDPAKLAAMLLHFAEEKCPPLRFPAGSDAAAVAAAKLSDARTEYERWRALSGDTDRDDASA